ncbi:TspO/MBR family protein [Legionella longbeachae]|uniref:Putative tryptophan-rich sensory protein n=1 Tax=Legionella longbeachae serogroup 1 (strain NSW150) TaxID=661367 RepID=D3HJ04_LEGLN|nr:tryptophan-rich sensory protein [Legionella longbeachae]CBJ12385.1 putative tryptophan-rich sensory protein [Legionella longbeachae NSW150]HBD7398904.1 tryptophan-rich sensory protein [Legionella pneumophila]ARM32709.1 tryptophan-rich sensory protein [Legionella longbeachae]QIN32632.1 tryptophan-rich sensory protein [Legionella longbeachae]
MRKKNGIKLIIWILMFELIGFILGLLTRANIPSWYEGLYKSILTPPGWVFSVVWIILYAFLAIVGFILWQNRSKPQIRRALNLYLVQLIMNWVWTPLFFQLHWIGFSFLWIVVIIGLNAIIILNLNKIEKGITLLLIPYFLWIIFAGYLNGMIWILNSQA